MHIFFTCICEELRYMMKIRCTVLVLKHVGRTYAYSAHHKGGICTEKLLQTWQLLPVEKQLGYKFLLFTLFQTKTLRTECSSAFPWVSKCQHEGSTSHFHHSCKWNLQENDQGRKKKVLKWKRKVVRNWSKTENTDLKPGLRAGSDCETS